MDRYLEVNRKLSLAGHVVYSIATRSTSAAYQPQMDPQAIGGYSPAPDEPLTPDEKETLDLVHLLKIQESEACYLITDETGYIGESTRREIKWAQMLGIKVYLTNHALDEHLLKYISPDIPGDIRKAIRAEVARGSYDCSKDFGFAIYVGEKTEEPTPAAN
jgi:hypothetical protein